MLSGRRRHLFLDFREIALSDGEVRIDGIHALDGEQGTRIRLHHISRVHQPRTGAAVNRRVNVAVLQIQLRSFKSCLGGTTCAWSTSTVFFLVS